MFVVTGATGHVGGAIVEKLLAHGKKVKAIGRNRSKLSRLEKKGAEVAEGSMDDTVFLAKNFVGAEAVFVMVPPDMQSPDIHAHYDRFGQAIAKAVAESGVHYVVHLSSIGADMPKGNGPIAALHRQEQRLNAIAGVNVLHLRPGYFMENLFGSIPMIKGMGINGSAFKGDLKFPQIATKDIADHAAKRMQKKDFTGKSVQELLGPRDVSMQEATAVMGKAIGKPELPYVQFPYEDALKGMVGAGLSKSLAENFVEMSRAFNEGTVRIGERNAANSTSTPIEDFAKDFARAYQS
ncbi:MAG: azoB [Fibrobacteres bacterium]|nr:azoB [Fibrobacterota bacterium]